MSDTTKLNNAILPVMARMLWKSYGARAYQAFVVDNPAGRVPTIERAILRQLKSQQTR